MPSEIVLKRDVVFLLLPVFINEHGFKVVSKEVSVCGQVKLEISEDNNEKDKKRL